MTTADIRTTSSNTITQPLVVTVVSLALAAAGARADQSQSQVPAPAAQTQESGARSQSPSTRPGGAPAAIKNPLDGNAQAIRAGSESYRARCRSCHGEEGAGAERGSPLTGVWAAGLTDGQLFQTIRRGVSNTLLPHSFGPDNEIWAVLAYLRTLNIASNAPSGANVENGGRLFAARCNGCHQMNGLGGRLGPDLSRIGSSRSRPLLSHKIRHASSFFSSIIEGGFVSNGYQPVILVTRDGRRIRGIKKNEDAFSIQVMDARERIQGYVKANLQSAINDTTSLMPDFGPDNLPDRDLEDLVAYLLTARAETR